MKLDIGCGPNKAEGFIGLDQHPFPGVDHVVRLGSERLPFDDATIEEARMSHFLEHLTAVERCQLLNELYRVMKLGAQCTVIVPHWASSRAYGDPTHQWPPIGEMFWYYVKREWRMANAPHTDKSVWPQGYDCDFDATWGYGMHQSLMTRNPEFQQFAMNFYKESAQDLHVTITRR